MKKILDGIWQVGGDGLSAPGDAAVYLVAFGNKAALIDAGCGFGQANVLQNISRRLPPEAAIEYLFLTHCHYDHSGGAAGLGQAFGCKVVAHELDARFIEAGDNEVTAAVWYDAVITPVVIDRRIRTKQETFQIGSGTVQALHCPGHSPGSLVVLTEKGDKKVLFAQDVHGPLHPALLSNKEDYRASLEMLLQLQADILCEGHFGVVRGRRKVQAFIESFLQ